jgi:hypothetical protein
MDARTPSFFCLSLSGGVGWRIPLPLTDTISTQHSKPAEMTCFTLEIQRVLFRKILISGCCILLFGILSDLCAADLPNLQLLLSNEFRDPKLTDKQRDILKQGILNGWYANPNDCQTLLSSAYMSQHDYYWFVCEDKIGRMHEVQFRPQDLKRSFAFSTKHCDKHYCYHRIWLKGQATQRPKKPAQSDSLLKSKCEPIIQSYLRSPLKYEPDYFSMNIARKDDKENWISWTFKTTNEYGVPVRQRAVCVIQQGRILKKAWIEKIR